tara:strand:+ start:1334 stop:1492 length:159 start_codon:yes stop_codon:yes gene_type:complete
MSCSQNQMILEDLFEEILSELYITHKDDVISRKELEEIATTITQQRFEDMCQ